VVTFGNTNLDSNQREKYETIIFCNSGIRIPICDYRTGLGNLSTDAWTHMALPSAGLVVRF